jgi:CRISPR-associated protein Cmr4
MFDATAAIFYYAVTPVHMGAGSALGVIDNPIQRERHTTHPVFAGSGIKGAARQRWEANGGRELARRIFGPEREASEYAGAISFTDAQLVLFPVRAARKAFLYATCPAALARARRLLAMAAADPGWAIPALANGGRALLAADQGATHQGQLGLEWFAYAAQVDSGVTEVACWMARNALPEGDAHQHFREAMKQDFVLIPDEDFGFFVRHSTSVEPHVRINDESGAADDGGLFYTENLPPESLLLGLAMASRERGKKNGHQPLTAPEVLGAVRQGAEGAPGLDGQAIQLGGDATTGRGQVLARFLPSAAQGEEK